MHQFWQNPELVAAVDRVCSVAYGVPRQSTEIAIDVITDAIPDMSAELLSDAIDALDRSGLLRRRSEGQLSLNAAGKRAYEETCVAELSFGDAFVRAKYSPAVLHVIVRNQVGDERGGTGFIISEPLAGIATAKHVLSGNELLRVETRDGTQLCGMGAEILLGPDGVDLAIIRTAIPAEITPLKIELHDHDAVDLEPVVVLGYPPIAGHEPTLIPVNAQATTRVPVFGGGRHSLVLQRMTTPGFSGSPVLDKRGRVIGIVREEGGVDRGNGPVVFVFGTPAHYLREISLVR